jgi:hypothetical protein
MVKSECVIGIIVEFIPYAVTKKPAGLNGGLRRPKIAEELLKKNQKPSWKN